MKHFIPIVLFIASSFCYNVILDPGHGGTDPGASGPSYLEKNANLDVAFYAKNYLESVSVTVGMTRSSDITLSLADRCAIANSGGWERFISIHENAYDGTVQGTETYCHPSGSSMSFDLRNKVQPQLIWAHSYTDRGTKTADFYVLRNTTMPAILGEGTFIDYTAGWNESWRYATNYNDHKGRQGFAYAKGYCQHRGITAPTYGSTGSDSIIVDNGDPGWTSSTGWTAGSYPGGWNGDYVFASATDTVMNWARWTPNIPLAGNYNVYMWWLAGANRCDNVFIRIHGTRNDSMFVSQKGTGSAWHFLGTYPFSAGSSGYVSLGDRTAINGSVVIADAVLWIFNSPLAIGDETQRPKSLSISAHPNPFNSTCNVVIINPEKEELNISFYDIAGKKIADNMNFPQKAEIFSFNFVPPRELPSGIYFMKVETNSALSVNRLFYIR